MNRKRERLEIILDVLTAIRDKGNGVKPTHILYKSNLSSDMLKDYLKELLKKKFILEEVDEKQKKTYSLTEKGFNYIKDFSVIKGFIESYGLD
jgi:predicted transcriptional regulator